MAGVGGSTDAILGLDYINKSEISLPPSLPSSTHALHGWRTELGSPLCGLFT